MLEAYLAEGKIYFLPNSIKLVKLVPISYRTAKWKLSFVDHSDQEHHILEGDLVRCCENIINLSMDNEDGMES